MEPLFRSALRFSVLSAEGATSREPGVESGLGRTKPQEYTKNRSSSEPRFRSWRSQLRNLPRRARPSLHPAKNSFVLRWMAGFNPEEALRIYSRRRFRPEGQIPKIGIWAEGAGEDSRQMASFRGDSCRSFRAQPRGGDQSLGLRPARPDSTPGFY